MKIIQEYKGATHLDIEGLTPSQEAIVRAHLNSDLHAMALNKTISDMVGKVIASVVRLHTDGAAAAIAEEHVATEKPSVEPGLPLRLFIRGFFRDHVGFSKILAHHAADLFMKRWNSRTPETMARYAREDRHTEEATLDRRVLEMTSDDGVPPIYRHQDLARG